jgi:hypothetical protein
MVGQRHGLRRQRPAIRGGDLRPPSLRYDRKKSKVVTVPLFDIRGQEKIF